MKVYGIDPAPSKPTCVFDGDPFRHWQPRDVAREVEDLTRETDVLIVWDAPLSMDPHDFYSRAIDKEAKRRVSGWKTAMRVEATAIGVSHAATCPHNLLTQRVFRLPMGEPDPWQLYRVGDPIPERGLWIAEAHPAVALGAWWASGSGKPLGRYKVGGEKTRIEVDIARGHLIDQLRSDHDFPGEPSQSSDDEIDAWVAWRLGKGLLDESVIACGPPGGGYYLMPKKDSWFTESPSIVNSPADHDAGP